MFMAVTPGAGDRNEEARAHWAENAAPWRKYRAEMAQQSRAATELILRLARVGPGMQVLDLASGTGQPALSLAAAVAPGGHVTATDLTTEMLATVEEAASATGLGTLSTQQADMEALPFPDHRFDVATCRFGIMFPAHVDRALREIRRVLRPGGRAAFLVWGTSDQPYFAIVQDIFMKYAQLPPPPPDAPTPFRFAQPGTLSAALREAGFAQVEEAAHTIPWSWPGTPEEEWAAMSEQRGAIFRQFREAVDDETHARATDEALAALHQYYDGHQITMPAQVIGATGTA